MPMYNLIEYSDNYADSSGSLWPFKRDEQNMNNGNPADVTTDDSSSFKYKSSLFRNLTAANANPNTSKKCKNNCSTKISNQLFQVIGNAIN